MYFSNLSQDTSGLIQTYVTGTLHVKKKSLLVSHPGWKPAFEFKIY